MRNRRCPKCGKWITPIYMGSSDTLQIPLEGGIEEITATQDCFAFVCECGFHVLLTREDLENVPQNPIDNLFCKGLRHIGLKVLK